MQQPDDHVSLFFYIDRDFVGSARSLHLHVRLTGGEERRPSQESPQTNRRPKQEKPGLAFGPFVEFCEPSDTYYSPTTKVRATGSSPGTICVIGRTLISDGVLPDAIYGKIYEEGASIPASIPSDAQEGAFVSSSACPERCREWNFIFDSAHNGELGGALHSAVPNHPENTIAIWITFGSSVYGPFEQNFLGKTSTMSECDEDGSGGSGSNSGNGGLRVSNRIVYGSKKCLLISQGPFPDLGYSVELINEGALKGTLLSWSSCPQARPKFQWQLWVNAITDRLIGTL
ncbi:MAG: hypothetical protein KDA84_03105, partial [Planctomycetaceae bacterium]|nr:hypothetical protein [Planctomycetaceae bacterium]